ncbi:DCC1-like thiol-disulfide oxidoreductase family protein [Algiphilus sp.]|uniref:DCC1-like thiol-disulfide oxidoreductase family protein n=1 Tax=Algiphilus sp. TaxID=1872431 RepID=UPI003B52D84C
MAMTHALQRWWRTASSIDLRGLAALRVLLGGIVFCDMLARLGALTAFYSDEGILPRATLLEAVATHRFSLLMATGAPWWAAAVIVIAALAALAFALGWRTRLANLVLFIAVGSIQSRQPLILIGGDILIMALLFWCLLLPTGARWSADAALASASPPPRHRYRSLAAFGLLVQVVSVYFFSAVLKHGDAWWPDGTAVYYALELDRYATDFGRWLQQWPTLTQGLSYGVYGLEWLVPLLVFAPLATYRLRLLAFVLLMGMHLGFLLCLELGHFPWVSMASLMALTTPGLWQTLRRRLDPKHPTAARTRTYYDRDCAFCRASCRLLRVFLVLPRTRIEAAQDTPRAHRLMEAHWSWVIIDGERTAHLKFDAFIALLRASLLFRWLAPLMQWSPIHRFGTATYDRVANGRGAVAAWTHWFWQSRPVRWRFGNGHQTVAVVALLAITVWNATTVDWLSRAWATPLAPLMQTLRLDQRWDMFAPEPSRRDGWIVFPATLENGETMDLRRPRQALRWERPEPPNAHRNLRWHSYEWRLYALRNEALFLAYGRYLCRQYNSDAPAGERLLRFDMVYVIEASPPRGGQSTAERRTAWHHRCLPDEPTPSPRTPAS